MTRASRSRHQPDKTADVVCWCGASTPAQACCAPLLWGETAATDALSLMRSRYSAYVTENEYYLLETWHPDTRPQNIVFDPERQWLGLKIYSHCNGQPGDKQGMVEFAARFKINGKGHRLRERSQFVFEQNRWLYLRGQLIQ